jgi:hypothetical protein
MHASVPSNHNQPTTKGRSGSRRQRLKLLQHLVGDALLTRVIAPFRAEYCLKIQCHRLARFRSLCDLRRRRSTVLPRRGEHRSPVTCRVFVNLNPVTHLITAVRDLAEKNAVSSDMWWALLGAAIIVVIFAPITVRLYMRKA